MTPRFLKIIPWLFQWEGVKFENDPDDPGGATKFGVDLRSYLSDHPGASVKDILNLTADQAQQIYWDDYWNRYHCEDMPYPLGEVYFNCCVNCGLSRARTLFQQATGDPKPAVVATNFLDYQDSFYRRLAAARPSSGKFLAGWLNRTADLRKFLSIA